MIRLRTLLSCLLVLASAHMAYGVGATINYSLGANTTAALAAVPAGNQPLFLFFALNNSDPLAVNSYTLNFTNLGGGSLGPASGGDLSIGSGTGPITLTDSPTNSAFFLQQWTPGTDLSFSIELKDQFNLSASADQVQFAILYKDTGNGFDINAAFGSLNPGTLPTGDDYLFFNTTGGISFLEYEIRDNNQVGSAVGYVPDGSGPIGAGPFDSPFIIPEPTTYVVWAFMIGSCGFYFVRRNMKKSALVVSPA